MAPQYTSHPLNDSLFQSPPPLTKPPSQSIGLSMDAIGEQLEVTDKLIVELNDRLFVILGESTIEAPSTAEDYPASSPLQDKLNSYSKSLNANNVRIKHLINRINL